MLKIIVELHTPMVTMASGIARRRIRMTMTTMMTTTGAVEQDGVHSS